MSTTSLTFRIASEEWEFEQIHRLNYKTFVEEIPQHEENSNKMMVDKFHHENTYIICLRDLELVGMVAVRDKRPFSLDMKLTNLDNYLPPHHSICEVRLLAVEKDYRIPRVFQGIMKQLSYYFESQGYDLAVISGTIRQLKLYENMGFVPFGELTGSPDAQFQPMFMTRETFLNQKKKLRMLGSEVPGSKKVNFLPGPVTVSEPVRKAFCDPPLSHRSPEFIKVITQTKHLLRQLTGSRAVEILEGSGTLANDVIGGQLSLLNKPGLVLSNGEFGNRLIDHAVRFGLSFTTLKAEWGHSFAPEEILQALEDNKDIRWIWAVHCETSSGILNDLALLRKLCTERTILLCMDCISSIGVIPVNLRGIYLASGVSGKGLGSYPGLSMVFHNQEIDPLSGKLPRYIDLELYSSSDGVPFTFSSNLVYALHAALLGINSRRFQEISALSSQLKLRLLKAGLNIIAAKEPTSPAVVTISLPDTVRSERLGDQLEKEGYLLSFRSRYLVERNLIQVCMMGENPPNAIDSLGDLLERLCLQK